MFWRGQDTESCCVEKNQKHYLKHQDSKGPRWYQPHARNGTKIVLGRELFSLHLHRCLPWRIYKQQSSSLVGSQGGASARGSVGSLYFKFPIENQPSQGQRPQRCHWHSLSEAAATVLLQHKVPETPWTLPEVNRAVFTVVTGALKLLYDVVPMKRNRSHCWSRSLLLLMVIIKHFYSPTKVLLLPL